MGQQFEEYLQYDATGLAELVMKGDVTPSELLESALARAHTVNPQINAICTPMFDLARQRAIEPLTGVFAGVPFLIKDFLQEHAGIPSTLGSRAGRQWRVTEHAEVVRRFLDSGLVIFGVTACPELGLKAVTESERYGVTRNPWNLQLTPGGSSGGAAAAVAAGIVPMAGANDGGGSIRIPASYCGLFGLRPSRGRVPSGPRQSEYWHGANSDLVVCRSVRDAAGMLDVLCGPDVGAPYVIPRPDRAFADEVGRDPGHLRIAFSSRSPLGGDVAPAQKEAVDATVRLLSDLGHRVEEAVAPVDGEELARCYQNLYFVYAAVTIRSMCLRNGAAPREFEPSTRVLGALGQQISAADYVADLEKWNQFARSMGAFFQTYDLYLTPTVAQPPAQIGETALTPFESVAARVALVLRGEGILRRLGLVEQSFRKSLERTPFTQLANLTGTPAMSVPMYWDGNGLPVGVQFIARNGAEALLLRLAAQLEVARPWAQKRPPAIQ
jgi:amidase